MNEEIKQTNDVIAGKNAVNEALRSGREIDRLLIVRDGDNNKSIGAIISECRKRKIPIKEIPPQKMDFLAGTAVHQGVAVTIAAYEYSSVEAIIENAKKKGESPFVIICDEIEDPHNLGAIIRTAEACAVHGIIIPERRSASLNSTVAKSSSGALEYVPVARVTNLVTAMNTLKENGVWIYGADMDGEDYESVDFSGGCALVIGNEGKGIGRLISENCDRIVSLPMYGKINSLNASVAAAVLMYRVATTRNK